MCSTTCDPFPHSYWLASYMIWLRKGNIVWPDSCIDNVLFNMYTILASRIIYIASTSRNWDYEHYWHNEVILLSLLTEIDGNGKHVTKIYDLRDDFTIHIVNFAVICENLPFRHVYGFIISNFIFYIRACHNYADVLYSKWFLTTSKVYGRQYNSQS